MSKAVSIEPSGDFDGNDGKWSTFAIQIGIPPQVVKLLIATSGQETLAVTPDACTEADVSCRNGRGYLYNMSASSTWSARGFYQLSETNSDGEIGTGYYGFDTVQTGWPGHPGVAANRSIVAGTSTGPYIGLLGISPRPTNFSDFNNPEPSFLTLLKQSGQISSLSYGYTAGAHYRDQGIQASLTIGGYDRSRFAPNNVSFTFNPVTYRDLVVQMSSVKALKSPPNTQITALTLYDEPIYVLLDGGTSHIWLPPKACKGFEDALELQYSEQENSYRLNTSTHEKLIAQNYTFTFEIVSNASEKINISIPYAAFDIALDDMDRNTSSSISYFPLHRASNKSQYILGRAFLQEAYIIVDYERGNFSIHQARWDTRENIVAIDSVIEPRTLGSARNRHTGSLEGWAKVAIPVIVIVMLIICLLGIWLVWKWLQKKRRKSDSTEDFVNGDTWQKPELEAKNRHEIDGAWNQPELDTGLKPELEGDSKHPQLIDSYEKITELDTENAARDLYVHPVTQEPDAEHSMETTDMHELPG